MEDASEKSRLRGSGLNPMVGRGSWFNPMVETRILVESYGGPRRAGPALRSAMELRLNPRGQVFREEKEGIEKRRLAREKNA